MAIYFKAADAYRASEFNQYMDNIRIMHLEAAKCLKDNAGLHN